MPREKRPASLPEGASLRKFWAGVTERGLGLKFHGGSGVHLARDNPAYYETVGRWLCTEIEAMALADDPYTPPREAP